MICRLFAGLLLSLVKFIWIQLFAAISEDMRWHTETLEDIRRHSQISGDVWTPLETSTRNYSKIVDNSAVWNNCYLSTGKLAKWFQNYDKWKTIYDVVWMIDSIDSIRLVVFFIERFAFIRVAIITNITSLSTGNVHLLSRHSLLTQINSTVRPVSDHCLCDLQLSS